VDGAMLGIRPEHLRLSADGAGVPVVVSSEDYHGADTVVGVRTGNDPDAHHLSEIMVRVPGRARPARGERLRLTWDAGALHCFGPDGRRQDPLPRALPLPV